MKRLSILLTVFAVLAVIPGTKCLAQANSPDKGGNGGDVLVCPNRTILLDRYEAEKRNFVLDLPGASLRAKVFNVLERLKPVDQIKYKSLKVYSNELVTDLEYYEQKEYHLMKLVSFTNDELNDIDDSMELSIPGNCKKRQLVIQQAPLTAYDQQAFYFFQKNLWGMLDENEKALTVLHEAWYRLALQSNDQDSRGARLLNTYTASTLMEKNGVKGYIDAIKNVNKLKSNLTYSIEVSQIELKVNLNSYVSYEDASYSFNLKDRHLNLLKSDTAPIYVLSGSAHKVFFNPNGGLKEVQFFINRIVGYGIHLKNGSIYLSRNHGDIGTFKYLPGNKGEISLNDYSQKSFVSINGELLEITESVVIDLETNEILSVE